MGCLQSKTRGEVVPRDEFYELTNSELLGDVRKFSGCKDTQTSADVENVEDFGVSGLPHGAAELSGGACTNALLACVQQKQGDITYGKLLLKMQRTLKERGYTQVPQLSSSKPVELMKENFSIWNPKPNGRTRALLIGINYVGQEVELKGCCNDVSLMKTMLEQEGWSNKPSDMRVLLDDGKTSGKDWPTAQNILDSCRWLVDGAKEGDSLFVHFSGHGSQLPDDDGDEEDGLDETMVPVDFQESGQIRDDTLFKLLVAPLPKGVQMIAVFDCCHSGSMLDLPYELLCTEQTAQDLVRGKVTKMVEAINKKRIKKWIEEAKSGLFHAKAEFGMKVGEYRKVVSEFVKQKKK